ncbi:MAG TPA: hypothetical protein VHE81_07965 [Lacipirellulaceae bacterium]|nr:hypothetical protein [Lacipirellulaceae bacterium]
MTTRQRQERQTGTYRELIGIAEEVIDGARAALRQTRKARGKDMITDLVIGACPSRRKSANQILGKCATSNISSPQFYWGNDTPQHK